MNVFIKNTAAAVRTTLSKMLTDCRERLAAEIIQKLVLLVIFFSKYKHTCNYIFLM